MAHDWTRVARTQGGVISRAQLHAAGQGEHDVRRLLRRRDITRIYPGVYVDHNGPLTWEQRAWAAVLLCWPAALGARSALPNPPRHAPITVIVSESRDLRPPRGVVLLRRRRFAEEIRQFSYPPRQRAACAAIDAALGAPTDADAYELLAGLVQRSVVTADGLREALGSRGRVRNRSLLAGLIDDLGIGACSVLEREYLRRVERAHGLPRPVRQARDSIAGESSRRDVLYPAYGLVIELDGRAFHDTAVARDRDGRRDLAAAVHRDLRTIRVTTGQVLDDACETAAAIAELLHRGGWTGSPTACPRCSSIAAAANG